MPNGETLNLCQGSHSCSSRGVCASAQRETRMGRAARQSLDAAGVESEWWDAAELTERFPQFRVSQRHGHPLAEGHRFPSCR